MVCNQMHPTINSTHYYAKILTITWQAVLKIWKLCNQHLHPSNISQSDCTQLQATVEQIFHNIQQDPNLCNLLTYTNPEQIITKPTQEIQQWVINCNNHICNQQKAAKIKAKLCTHDIQQYFNKKHGPQPSTTDKNLLLPTLKVPTTHQCGS